MGDIFAFEFRPSSQVQSQPDMSSGFIAFLFPLNVHIPSLSLLHKFFFDVLHFKETFHAAKLHHDSSEDIQAVLLFLHFAQTHRVTCLQLFIASVWI